MVGYPKHALPSLRLQVERTRKAAALQLKILREQREKQKNEVSDEKGKADG
jgi:hypothetical protein